jgi:TonB family protein
MQMPDADGNALIVRESMHLLSDTDYRSCTPRRALGETLVSTSLSLLATAAIFLSPLLISVEMRTVVAESLDVFLLEADRPDGPDEDRASPARDRRADAGRTAEPQRARDPKPTESAASGEGAARPGTPSPATLPLPDRAVPLALAESALPPRPIADIPISLPAPSPGQLVSSLPRVGAGGTDSDGAGSQAGKGGAPRAGGGEGGRGTSIHIASWAPSMDFARDNRHYPRAAAAARVEGVAWLKCQVVRDDRVRRCRLLGESPQGYGFGKAALKTAPNLRIQLHDQTGRRVYGEWTLVTSTFRLSDLRGE